MNIDLKVLHLQRPLRYAPMERPASVDETALSELAARCRECLLAFDANSLSTLTDDGPALTGTLVPSAAYAIAAADGQERFELAPGDYLFFQWRAKNASGRAANGHASGPPLSQIFEEIVREAWWQRLECSGPWFLRLVPEDGRLALQILRRVES